MSDIPDIDPYDGAEEIWDLISVFTKEEIKNKVRKI